MKTLKLDYRITVKTDCLSKAPGVLTMTFERLPAALREIRALLGGLVETGKTDILAQDVTEAEKTLAAVTRESLLGCESVQILSTLAVKIQLAATLKGTSQPAYLETPEYARLYLNTKIEETLRQVDAVEIMLYVAGSKHDVNGNRRRQYKVFMPFIEDNAIQLWDVTAWVGQLLGLAVNERKAFVSTEYPAEVREWILRQLGQWSPLGVIFRIVEW